MAEVLIPIAAENLIAKCPNPPIPIIATSFFGLKYLFKGAKTVIPAHKRGGAKCYGIVFGIGKAHLAGNYTCVANPPNLGKGIKCSSPFCPQS